MYQHFLLPKAKNDEPACARKHVTRVPSAASTGRTFFAPLDGKKPAAGNPCPQHFRKGLTGEEKFMDSATINLELILDGCRRGNRASQMKLYELYYSYAMAVCLPYARSREEAEEMVNDGFMKVFTRLDQYDGNMPFKPWLRRVMINTAIDYHRKHHKLDRFDELQDYHARELSPITNDALENLEYEDVIRLLQQLTPGYRAVFVLYVLEGYSHQDIAEELGISVGASKSNLAKARRKLQELLAQKQDLRKRT